MGITGFIPWEYMRLLSFLLESATKTLVWPFAALTVFSNSFRACFFSFWFAGAAVTANGRSELASTAKWSL
jgi:hypothetical protein